MSLILGSVQGPRGRNFSATIAPKFSDTKLNINAVSESTEVVRRKKSISNNRNSESRFDNLTSN